MRREAEPGQAGKEKRSGPGGGLGAGARMGKKEREQQSRVREVLSTGERR